MGGKGTASVFAANSLWNGTGARSVDEHDASKGVASHYNSNIIMSATRQIPTALLVVAILFLISGIGSVIDVVFDLIQGNLNLNFGVMGIPIFFGLRRLSSAWRTCALIFLWIGMLGCTFTFLLGLTDMGSASFKVFSIHITNIPSYCVSLAAVPAFFLVLWQHRVLTAPLVRDLFVPAST